MRNDTTKIIKISPLSENSNIYREDWDKENCISELQRIANIDPEMVVTRNYFRNHALCSESTWNRYFGTFEEYKRQAGLKLSRQQHALEKQIALSASQDHYESYNTERRSYAGSYLRPTGRRFVTGLIFSDIHDKNVDPFYLRLLLDTASRVQPDFIVANGDIYDLPEFGRYNVDPRDWDVVGRVEFIAKNLWTPLRKACPDVQIDLIEGNHEFRLVKHLADASPALKVLLSDLHSLSVGSLLGLKQFEINYIAKADLAAYKVTSVNKEVAKNYKVFYDCFITHHFPEGARLGLPGCNGHHHKWHMTSHYNQSYGSYMWTQLGAGHKRDAEYTDGQRWNNGFLMVHIDTVKKLVQFEPVIISDHAMIGGKLYEREESEAV